MLVATKSQDQINTECRNREKARRIEEKIKLLEEYNSSQDLFNELAQAINTLSNDESTDDFSVGDEYNYGTDYEIDLLLELTSDLRWFTRLDRKDDDKTINEFNLNYLREYF